MKIFSRFSNMEISIQWKWTLMVSAVIFLVYLIFSLLFFYSISFSFLRDNGEELEVVTERLAQGLKEEDETLDRESVHELLNPKVINFQNDDVERYEFYDARLFSKISDPGVEAFVYGENGQLIYGTSEPLQELQQRSSQSLEPEFKNGTLNIISESPIYTDDGVLIGYIQMSDELQEFNAFSKNFAYIAVLLGVFALLLSGVIGYCLAGRLLSPIKTIADDMKFIRKDNYPEERIDVGNRKDEIQYLAHSYNEMLDRIQENILQQQRFVSDVSHELRTPVSIIEGHLKMLSRWGKSDPEILEESLNASLEEISRMKTMVNQMLDLTRSEQDIEKDKVEDTQVLPIIVRKYNDFKLLHPNFQIVLENQLTMKDTAKIHSGHLSQLMVILFDNAIKYSKDEKRIELFTSKDQDYISISVKDYGRGISESELDKIFDRFFRADESRVNDTEGTGLGLSIAQNIINRYEGDIKVESELGRGTRFTVLIPRSQNKQD